jgi:hypothetical protein
VRDGKLYVQLPPAAVLARSLDGGGAACGGCNEGES